jgi:hypothetical protein
MDVRKDRVLAVVHELATCGVRSIGGNATQEETLTFGASSYARRAVICRFTVRRGKRERVHVEKKSSSVHSTTSMWNSAI